MFPLEQTRPIVPDFIYFCPVYYIVVFPYSTLFCLMDSKRFILRNLLHRNGLLMQFPDTLITYLNSISSQSSACTRESCINILPLPLPPSVQCLQVLHLCTVVQCGKDLLCHGCCFELIE